MPEGQHAILEEHLVEAEQLRFSEALRESEHRYSNLLQGLPAAVYTCDSKGRVMLYNRAAVALWGREPEAGKDLWCGSWRIYRPDGTVLPLDQCPMAIALSEGRAVQGEEIIIETPDGVRRHVLPHPQPIFDVYGNLVEAVNMLVDITEQRNTQHALRESEERFRTMADQAPNMIWMSDLNNNAVYVNAQWCEFVGKPAENGYGRGWLEHIHPEDKQNALLEWKQAFQRREPYIGKFRYRNAKGQYRFVSASCSPRLSNQGQFMGYIGILNDVTTQENAKTVLQDIVEERTRDLIKANTELKRSNLDLEQLAYVASHDLQEPLRKIQTFANLLQKKNKETLNEESVRFLNNITNSANRLSHLIDDLLNFSRLSAPTGVFVKTDLNEIWDKVKNDFELLITSKNAIIREQALPHVEAIPFQLTQLFSNLLANSLKFSSSERDLVIDVSCRTLSKEELKNYEDLQEGILHWLITFADNGIGFEQEYADQIFLIFQRLHGQSLYPGSGIGLALCRKILLNHRGKISADGNKEKGSTFYVILPETQPSQAEKR